MINRLLLLIFILMPNNLFSMDEQDQIIIKETPSFILVKKNKELIGGAKLVKFQIFPEIQVYEVRDTENNLLAELQRKGKENNNFDDLMDFKDESKKLEALTIVKTVFPNSGILQSYTLQMNEEQDELHAQKVRSTRFVFKNKKCLGNCVPKGHIEVITLVAIYELCDEKNNSIGRFLRQKNEKDELEIHDKSQEELAMVLLKALFPESTLFHKSESSE